MLFVALCKQRVGSLKESLARRLEWSPPEGVRVVSEYWLETTDPATIMIFEAESMAPVMAARADWADLLDVTVIPAIPAEEGLQLAKQMLKG